MHKRRLLGTSGSHALIFALDVILCFPAVALVTARLDYRLDVLVHFLPYYIPVVAVLIFINLLFRQFKSLFIPGATLLALLITTRPYYLPWKGNASGPGIRLMHLNVNWYVNQNFDRVFDLIAQEQPEILCLLEIGRAWQRKIEELPFSHKFYELRDDPFGIGVFSNLEIIEPRIVYFQANRLPCIHFKIRVQDRLVELLYAHNYPPLNGGASFARNDQTRNMAQFIRDGGNPFFILVGDLNVTPWSPHFKDLLDTTGMADARWGRGINPSWRWFDGLLRLPLDHFLYGKGIAVRDLHIGPSFYSDHLPLSVKFDLAP